MAKKTQKGFFGKKRLGVSPILATTMLLGITVVGGGLAYSVFSQSSDVTSSSNLLAIEGATALKGTSHADMSLTIKNIGSKPWKEVQMTASKSELSEPIAYESLHENVAGCDTASNDGKCSKVEEDERLDNPLRAQWVVNLDKTGGTSSQVDNGEGASVGRKWVLKYGENAEDGASWRSVSIKNGTAVAKAFGESGTNNLKDSSGNAVSCSAADSSSWVDCSKVFKALDPSTKVDTSLQSIPCRAHSSQDGDIECKVWTHKSLKEKIAPGQTVYIYADLFTKKITGLNNAITNVGDSIVVNLVVKADDGSSTKTQTIVKVEGI